MIDNYIEVLTEQDAVAKEKLAALSPAAKERLLSMAVGALSGAAGSGLGSSVGAATPLGHKTDIPEHILSGALAGAAIGSVFNTRAANNLGAKVIGGSSALSNAVSQMAIPGHTTATGEFLSKKASIGELAALAAPTAVGAALGATAGYAMSEKGERRNEMIVGATTGAAIGGALTAINRTSPELISRREFVNMANGAAAKIRHYAKSLKDLENEVSRLKKVAK